MLEFVYSFDIFKKGYSYLLRYINIVFIYECVYYYDRVDKSK